MVNLDHGLGHYAQQIADYVAGSNESVMLYPEQAGDFNADLYVNAADFTVLFDEISSGTPKLLADVLNAARAPLGDEGCVPQTKSVHELLTSAGRQRAASG